MQKFQMQIEHCTITIENLQLKNKNYKMII